MEFTHPGAWMNMWACVECGAIVEDRMADRHEGFHKKVDALEEDMESEKEFG